MGIQLSKLTDIIEKIEHIKLYGCIGSGGLDSFDPSTQDKLYNELTKRIEKLRNYQPYEINKTLISNLKFNQSTSDDSRANAIEQLYLISLDEKIALDMDTFKKAFGTKK